MPWCVALQNEYLDVHEVLAGSASMTKTESIA